MKQTIQFGNRSIKLDIGLIAIILLMGFTSIFSLYNAFNLISDGSGSSYMIRQIVWYIIGFIAIFFLSIVQNKKIFQYVKTIYYILLGTLIYLFVSRIFFNLFHFYLPMAPPINGAVSWFIIPLIGSFQPSEFIKIVLIIMISQIIQDHQARYPNPTRKDDIRLIVEISKVLLPPLVLVFLQPDAGVAIIMFVNTLVLVICSGIRKEYIWIIFILLILAVLTFFFLYFNYPSLLSSIISAYRLQRIEAWLEPESHIQGSSNQLYTALLSMGSAGITGYGMQANIIAIPEAHTDFIFAAVGQCFGLVGTSFILFVCLLLDLYLCRIAYSTKNRMDRYIVIGVIAMLAYQQLQNLGMIVGLVPITGITLPLISYGGSSILSYFICFAIILNLSPPAKKTIRLEWPQLPKNLKFRRIEFPKRKVRMRKVNQ